MSDEPAECPLCMETLEIDDQSFFPCTCGYQICRFCWHRIRTDENGLCPACRKQYPEAPADFKPLTDDELQNIKKERKQKDVQRKQKAAENRKHLANVRVVQRNLVFVVGLSPRLADPEVLKKNEYFGKFGKIHKVVINQSTSYAGSQGPSASAYVTYVKPEDALKAILTVNNVHVDGRTLKTSLGTTKYCSHFLKGTHCQKNDCMYLHELGEDAASFTKDEMQAGKHQEYEQMLIDQVLNAQNSANNHHSSHSKLKKSTSPHATENTEVIPSLMDMTGDIKHSLPSSGPLLPKPVHPQTNGRLHTSGQNSGWPLLESGTNSSIKSEGKTQGNPIKPQQRTNTPPGGAGGGNLTNSNVQTIGKGRQRSTNSTNSDENHIHKRQASSGSLVSQSDGETEVASSSPQNSQGHRNLPLPTPAIHQQNSTPPLPGLGSNTSISLSTSNLAQNQIVTEQNEDSIDENVGTMISNAQPTNDQGLSFFANSLLNPSSAVTSADKICSLSELQNGPLASHELCETLPVSSSTDWSAAFGFHSSDDVADLPTDDDLGFDPCAESFKGLADLIEKENDLQQQQLQSSSQLNHLDSQQQLSYVHPASLSPQQNHTHPTMRNLPPGFSMSQIQQQQQQLQQQHHFFRPELTSSSKMLELLPQFGQPTPQRFTPLHSFSNMPSMELLNQQQQQRDAYTMKDMQEQLRSMLPNINISFGTPPHQQQQQMQNSLHPVQHNQKLNKSWPLSSSPDNSPWSDPAIVSTSQFTDSTESSWLKSLGQVSDTEASNHRLRFVQQFPLSGSNGWPPHTHNPPPGFRNAGLSSQQSSDSHQMAEVLQ